MDSWTAENDDSFYSNSPIYVDKIPQIQFEDKINNAVEQSIKFPRILKTEMSTRDQTLE